MQAYGLLCIAQYRIKFQIIHCQFFFLDPPPGPVFKSLKLQTLKSDMIKNVILRIGEFHTVLCTLRELGSTIESSAIDEAWVEADLYGPTTTRQILEGKHMKMALDAHSVTLLAFFELLVERLDTSLLSKLGQETDSLGVACMQANHVGARMLHRNLDSAVDKSSFLETLEEICKTGEQVPMFKFAYDYMKTVAVLLSIIQVPQGVWLLHLASLEHLCPLKYAQHVPEYIAKMYKLQESDSAVWDAFMEGNFCVKKGSIPFTSQQENRKMKVLGGLSGLTRRPARSFLVAPELSRLSLEADNLVGVSSEIPRHHYQLSEPSNQKQEQKIQRLRCVIEHTNPFQYEGTDLINLISKIVLPEETRLDVLRQYDAGKEAYTVFVKERIVGTVNLWSPMPKVKESVLKLMSTVKL